MQSYKEGHPDINASEMYCSHGETSLNRSPSPGPVCLTENPFLASCCATSNQTYADAWHVYITLKAFLLTPSPDTGYREPPAEL